MFSGNHGFHYNQTPEWYSRHKKLPGLSGFVTLGMPGVFENNEQMGGAPELEKMDIQSLVQQDFNFNLGKIFDENGPGRHFTRESALDLGLEGMITLEGVPSHHKNVHRHQPAPKKNSKHLEKTQVEHHQENKMSFFKEYLPMLLDHHWREIVENSQKFFEFEKEFDAQKHAENLMFLEEHKETYGNAFENIYHSHYGKIIGKLSECVQSYNLTADTLLKIFYDDLCSLLSDLFLFMKDCTSDYCFSLLKNKTQNAKNNRNTNQPSGMAPEPVPVVFESPMRDQINQAQQKQSMPMNEFMAPNFSFKKAPIEENKGERMQTEGVRPTMNVENLEALANLIDFNVGRREEVASYSNSRGIDSVNVVSGSDIESVASENTRKMQRKYWSQAEQQELENLSIQYHPHNIPIDRLEEFARKYNRTLNAVQSKISKTKKEKARKQSSTIQVNALAPTGSRAEAANAQRKYEVSVEKMIKGALQQFPENTATKKEIIDKIKEMFFGGELQVNEEKLKNSISQTLSSSKSITKIKGTYGLRSRAYVIVDFSFAKTMKSRLQYIFSNCANYHADITTIRRLYWEYFSDTVDADKVWETSIAKILKQSNEFDTSNCKTKYCLIGTERQD